MANDFGMSDFWKKSLDFQQNMFKEWMGALQGAAQPATEPVDNPLAAMTKMYQDMYTNWQNQFLSNPLMKMYPWSYNLFTTANTPFDVANKMMNGGKAYTDLFNIWQNLAGKDPFQSRDEILKFIETNKASFEKLSHDFLLPFLPENARPFVEQAQALMKQFENAGEEFVRPWLDISKENSEDLQKILKGDGSGYINLYNAMNKAYEETYGKVFNVSMFGATKEQNEELLSEFDSYFKMMLALTELMSVVSDVSKDNSIALIENYQDQVKKGSAPQTMMEFYKMWLNINEDSFERVFATPQFSKVFGAFAKRACEFKIHCDKVMERMLSSLPIPTNKDMTSLYKTVYKLRKSDYFNTEDIRTLKEEVAALKAELASKKSK